MFLGNTEKSVTVKKKKIWLGKAEVGQGQIMKGLTDNVNTFV